MSQFIFSNLKGDFDEVKLQFDEASRKKKKPQLKQLLAKAEKQKEKIQKLKVQGKVDVAAELKRKKRWETAFARAEGKNIKDDVNLIKKTIKRVQKKKEKSRKLWNDRKRTVEQKQEKRQLKRNRNIEARKTKKKEAKVKHLKKKGRILF